MVLGNKMFFVGNKFLGFNTENELLVYADNIKDDDNYFGSIVAVVFKGTDAQSPNPKRLEYDIRFRPSHFSTSSLFSFMHTYFPDSGTYWRVAHAVGAVDSCCSRTERIRVQLCPGPDGSELGFH